MSDPTIWVGLATLIVLEIVLGIDNLVFIAILTEKLPPQHRDRARVLGLALACIMRLALLASISWIMRLTAPVVTLWALALSWRDLILVGGGAFLLIKATIEIHDRLEVQSNTHAAPPIAAAFWPIVAQIVALDAVFSIDSVITAVGMVEQLAVMMVAVVIAVAVMIAASKPLTNFVNAHPSLIILCLGFLLMVGLVLIVDGLGYHIPKGYLYAAIGFSVLIESFNQLALRNRRRSAAAVPLRQRTAETVLRLLGAVPRRSSQPTEPVGAKKEAPADAFTPAETQMVRDVLLLADRPVHSIMTHRHEIIWIDAAEEYDAILTTVRSCEHRYFIVSRESLDNIVGIARRADLVEICLDGSGRRPVDISHEPMTLFESASILDALRTFRRSEVEMALVVDEYGSFQGIVTQADLLEAIAGNLPPPPGEAPDLEELGDGKLGLHAAMSIHDARERLGLASLPEGDFNTLAGMLLYLFERMPAVGESVEWDGWRFEIAELDGMRVSRVIALPTATRALPPT